jgi:hypothetical protein
MPSNSSSKGQPVSRKKQAPAPRRTSTEVQPISPLGVLGAILIAVAIAGVLLFVINTRINGSRAAAPTPTVAPLAVKTPSGAATATPLAVNAPAGAATVPAFTQVGGFSRGDASAKVTVTEFGDFK